MSDEYTELDYCHDQISDLQAALVVANMGEVDPADKHQASTLIAELRSEIKTLRATNKAITTSRDTLMTENSQLKRQCLAQQAQIKKMM